MLNPHLKTANGLSSQFEQFIVMTFFVIFCLEIRVNSLTTHDSALRLMRHICVEAGKALMQKKAIDGTLVPLKFCYKPSEKGVYGNLQFVPVDDSTPCGFIDSGARLGISVPYANYFSWVVNHSNTLPVLAF